MQVVPLYWRGLIGRLAGRTFASDDEAGEAMIDNPALALRAGAAVLRSYYDQYGNWDQASSAFFTGRPDWKGADSVNGTRGGDYKRALNQLIAEFGAAAGTTPAPRMADPLSAILGGKPVPKITYGFGQDEDIHAYAFVVGHGLDRDDQHSGVDIPVPHGTKLYAPASGVVDCVGSAGTPRWGQSCGSYRDDMYGGPGNITILLDPGTHKLTLGHCASAAVRPGQRVAAGQLVGTSGGSNGDHVHVEVSIQKNGSYWLVEPVAALRSAMGGAAADPFAGYVKHQAPGLGAILLPPDVPYRVLLTEVAPNRTRKPFAPLQGLTQHGTGNPRMGAKGHAEWQAIGTPNHPDGDVSVHAYGDETGIWQTLPFDEQGIHAGDARNRTRIAFEFCELVGRTQAEVTRAEYVAKHFVAAVLRAKGWRAATHLDRHRTSGCPGFLNNTGRWAQWVADIDALVGGGTVPSEPEPDDLLLALFPKVDRSQRGIVSAAWSKARERDGQHYPYIRDYVGRDGATYWVFAGIVLRSKDGTVEEVEVRP